MGSRSRWGTRRNFLSMVAAIGQWNRLPWDLVMAPRLGFSKQRLGGCQSERF